MDLGLNGRTVLVTGASGTIGAALAVAFGQERARVAVAYHSRRRAAERTAERLREVGGEAMTVRLDLADQGSVERAAQQVGARLGPVEILVNNAVAWPGFPQQGERFETAPVERMRASLQANLLGPYLLARAVVAGMRERGWGRIVHLSTGLVEDGQPGGAAYLSAKGGLHGLARTMSRELAPAGILTNVVMAGFTPGGRDLPEEVLGVVRAAAATESETAPEEVARAVVFLCSDANTNITGEMVRVDGHFLTPR